MSDTKGGINPRELVLQVLMEVLEKGQYSHLMLKSILDKYAFLSKQDRSFISRLSNGVIERMLTLDYVIDQFSKTKVKKMKPLIRNVMRMGCYQILYMDKVPASAACNESVKLVKKHGFQPLSGFVNGVLRSIARQKDEISYPDKSQDFVQYCSVCYSMPPWIVSMWIEQFGEAVAEQLLQNTLSVRPLTIRIDALSEKEQASYLKELADSGVSVKKTSLPYAFELAGYDTVEALPGYAEGKFVVQDLGSMLIVQKADIGPADTVIDVCGAPGGKALHAAQKATKGTVSVRDVSDYKIAMITENIARSGLTNVEPLLWDATVLRREDIETADVVIADLPCSGLGVIGRKPEIKYRVTREDIREIAALQRTILDTVRQYVKVGGTLMYSTCTLTSEENEQNVEWFLANHPFRCEMSTALLPQTDGGGTDGFYMAKLIREKSDD